jgi:hypothetical protein
MVGLRICGEEETNGVFLLPLSEATKNVKKMIGECVYLNAFRTLIINTSLA